ncbi:gamma-glutamyl-gamma-aminobutyrate hydrolase family protein [Actinoallomurus purpureus]|uniref:gamma-glutamyl-gamma-aminobutyrate hydrolase family protein n=1 Tax=Actinoallomurus purpureus TaxID=478114 RepID=UPI0020935446|nr:gamma-glutamyl-gamma-aminobutyrate hydrolase family protein [Actinoallomurus purpureus]MCO6003451.1 gamma-glutamyl-gamma-aminobutyrate hydrolase family protein [Actinoallomurus purpureus]
MTGSTYGTGPALIGITTDLEPARWSDWVREAALLPASYLRALERARAVPVLVPPSLRAAVPAHVERLDGLVFAGGADLDPNLYGESPHERTGPPQPHRDRFELTLLRAAIETDLPFLAIGRGMQALNVVREGSLIQHLPDVVGGDVHAPASGRTGTHRVQISGSSALGRILGEQAEVATRHHQAVKRLGKGLVAVAWAEDQVVEAVELQGHRFGIGVQWHPEESDDPRLFEAFVRAASEGRF